MRFKYKFTVFTPCYNSEKTLHRVFESLMAQTIDHSAFEWLVINDASTDGTDRLIRRFIEKADFDVHYINNQSNQMLTRNMVSAVQHAQGELFLGIGHDDAFVEKTLEIFDEVWTRFTPEERERCGGIVALCQDQWGNRIGCDFPIENKFIPALEISLGWRYIGLGETWAALKTKNLLESFTIPEEAEKLRYIPESFFWTRIAIELKPHYYVINVPLRIYYQHEGGNISENIRSRYPDGFLFESKWFLKNYLVVGLRYPKVLIKHLIKFIYFSWKV